MCFLTSALADPRIQRHLRHRFGHYKGTKHPRTYGPAEPKSHTTIGAYALAQVEQFKTYW